MGQSCSQCCGSGADEEDKTGERQPLLNHEHNLIIHQPGPQRSLQASIREEESLKQIVDRTRLNTINIKELNSKTTSIATVDFGERSLRYQQLVKSLKAPSPIVEPEGTSLAEDEREWITRVGKDVKNTIGSMKVKDVGDVVVGFNL